MTSLILTTCFHVDKKIVFCRKVLKILTIQVLRHTFGCQELPPGSELNDIWQNHMSNFY